MKRWREPEPVAIVPNDDTAMITHDFPLRRNLTVRIVLPVSLTTEDVGRLTAFLNALAFNPADLTTEAREATPRLAEEA